MKILQCLGAALLVVCATAAQALVVKPYSAEALAEAQKANQPVALHFRADWCPTCRAQDKLIDAMKTESGLDVTVLAVNYDTEKDLKGRFNVRTQSTLVVFKSGSFSAAMSRTCFAVTLPTLSLFGEPEPFSTPAALRNRIATGGVFVSKVNERSL